MSDRELTSAVDHGCLPAWEPADLPEPLPFNLRNAMRTIGPGAILLAAAIGGGEWIVGPMMVVKYGAGILWIATAAILLQSIFNLEGCRYTLATGEPILTGIMRLSPGPLTWALVYGALGIAQLSVPALAKACAAVLFSAFYGRLPLPADDTVITVIASVIIIGSVMLLLSGKSIERLLERLSWAMIVFIFVFLIVANVWFVPAEHSLRIGLGFVTPRPLPANLDVALVCAFAATAGSGGLGNLVITNWFRDKGMGMGSRIGHIGGLAEHESKMRSVGCRFSATSENASRWRSWWKYALLDQTLLWAGGCFLGMFLNVNLASAIVPPDVTIANEAAGTFQAQYMAEHAWRGFWALSLLNGFWILYSTHLGNTDTLVRTLCDLSWAGIPTVRRWPIGRVYAVILIVLTVWGLFSIHLGNVLDLFKVLGVLASPILALAAVQILRVNRRFLPAAARPPLWRQIALGVCAVTYMFVTGVVVWDTFFKVKG